MIGRGYRADLNIIEVARLQLQPPRMVFDLPSGARHLMQQARGYVATLVAGKVVYRDGAAGDVLPGRLVRGAQPAPAG
jgi:N-acyl-D-aspartate/D-glutamate deacylase